MNARWIHLASVDRELEDETKLQGDGKFNLAGNQEVPDLTGGRVVAQNPLRSVTPPHPTTLDLGAGRLILSLRIISRKYKIHGLVLSHEYALV